MVWHVHPNKIKAEQTENEQYVPDQRIKVDVAQTASPTLEAQTGRYRES